MKQKNINKLKVLLANEATKILHGERASLSSEQTAIATFDKKSKNLPEIKISQKNRKRESILLNFCIVIILSLLKTKPEELF